MEEELDHILLEQLHIARRTSVKMKKARKIMGDDAALMYFQESNRKRIEYFEYMIQDKKLLLKKINKKKKKKQKNPDVLARNPLYEAWRSAFMITFLTYKTFADYMTNYWVSFKKDKNEKNDNEFK